LLKSQTQSLSSSISRSFSNSFHGLDSSGHTSCETSSEDFAVPSASTALRTQSGGRRSAVTPPPGLLPDYYNAPARASPSLHRPLNNQQPPQQRHWQHSVTSPDGNNSVGGVNYAGQSSPFYSSQSVPRLSSDPHLHLHLPMSTQSRSQSAANVPLLATRSDSCLFVSRQSGPSNSPLSTMPLPLSKQQSVYPPPLYR
jgi:hypothetical protein